MNLRFLILASVFLICITLRLAFLDKPTYQDGEALHIEGYISTSPKISSGRQIFRLQNIRINTDLVPEYAYGNFVRVEGTIRFKSFKSKGKSIEYFELKDPVITEKKQNIAMHTLGGMRKRITAYIISNLPSPESDLLVGILLGDDNGFDRKTKDSFSNAGLLHIVAASGTNISIVGGFFYFASLPIFGRKKTILISLGAILLYSLIAGFSPSIQRAALMGSIAYLGLFLGRQTTALWSLAVAGGILTLIDPQILLDIGFQLSFGATFGILVIEPYLKRIPLFSRGILAQDMSVTLSAYLALFPLLMYHFHTFSPFSLVTNVLVLWTIPLITVVGGVAILLVFVNTLIALPFLWVSYPFLHFIVFISSLFSKLFPPIVFDRELSILFVIGYYCMFLAVLLRLRK